MDDHVHRVHARGYVGAGAGQNDVPLKAVERDARAQLRRVLLAEPMHAADDQAAQIGMLGAGLRHRVDDEQLSLPALQVADDAHQRGVGGDAELASHGRAAPGRKLLAVDAVVYGEKPARVDVLPANARVAPGKRARFRVRAYAADGRELLLPENLTWTASPGIGTVDRGELLSGLVPGRGTITAVVSGVAGIAQVEVPAGP